MTTALQLAEFFFGNFWHWLGLFMIVAALSASIEYRRR